MDAWKAKAGASIKARPSSRALEIVLGTSIHYTLLFEKEILGRIEHGVLFTWIAASEAHKLQQQAEDFVAAVSALGPARRLVKTLETCTL